MERGIINKIAHERGELLSKTFAPRNVEARMAARYDGVVGSVNQWVDTVRERTGESIPYADPAAAIDGARVLCLFQDPSGVADLGSGFISRHNNDQTARNAYEAHELAGVDYATTLHWNVVPWWATKNPAFPGRTSRSEAPRARPFLVEFLDILGEPPNAIVVSGKDAQHAWQSISSAGLPKGFARTAVLFCPHPSPLVYPRLDRATARLNKDLIVDTFKQAQELASR